MAHLEIKHLRMLQMISKTENLTRAANQLCVSQSALSQQLKDIEGKLQSPLFNRTGKRMLLTPVGKKLLEKARGIIQEIDRAEYEIYQMVNGDRGELKIGVRCMFCYQWLAPVIVRFKERYPRIDLLINNCLEPKESLLSKQFDIVISAQEVGDTRCLQRTLFEDQLMCVLSRDHTLAGKQWLDAKDLQGADIISLIDRTRDSAFHSILYAQSVKPGRVMTVAFPEAIIAFVKAGVGISVLPRWFVAEYNKDESLYICPFTADGLTLKWRALYRQEKDIPRYQQHMIDLLDWRQAIK